MKMRLFLIFVVIGALLWLIRYPLMYHFYLYKINSTESGGSIIYYEEKIIDISQHIGSLLIRTYRNGNASEKSRHAAALALIEIDKKRAEDIFTESLESSDPILLSDAIRHLGLAGSSKNYKTVTMHFNSESRDVRWAVVDYLGKFKSNESIALLKQIMVNDKDSDIRSWASYQLQQFDALRKDKHK